jgi:serine/threonine protein kinase
MVDLPTTPIAGRYRIVKPLGRGAFARTFLAQDEQGARPVALKVLDPAQAADLKAFELFQREAMVLRSLRHHGVPEVFEAVRAEWTPGASVHLLVMEYVEGESLAAIIESGRRMDRPQVMHYFAELIGVLDYLHGRVPPILHRDIKPANIIIRPDGSPTLVDFGAVRAVHRADGGSTVAGTYGYMPYEQYMGQATPASDLYALGATFLHLVTGSAPATFISDAGRIEVPTPLPCGEPLATILTRLLRPAPNERFQSSREVRHAIFGVEPSSALMPVVSRSGAKLRRVAIELPSGPRKVKGPIRDLWRKVAPNTWRLINATSRSNQIPDFASVVLIGIFSVLTAGVLPIWFWSLSAGKRRRARPFFERGMVAEATVLGMELEDVGFSEKMSRVRYQFEVDGRLVRSSDSILPGIAERWQPGDPVQVLYLPDDDYDSIIISTS